tara:strand:- start:193 stop:468 length:276 start_codon:yes stop_codon:yes gene_type:complete
MTYSELSKLSISELRNLNSMVIETIKSKKSLLALETKDSLYVGAIVSVDHPKMAGHELRITKINRTKAVCEMVNGKGSYNVPLTMINIING